MRIKTEELKLLQNKFVVLIDKASGIVVFVCQKHYGQVLIDEVDLNDVNNINLTYVNVT